MPKWEYLIAIKAAGRNKIYLVNEVLQKPYKDFFEFLSEAGEDGWELIQAVEGVYIFKRPK